MPLSYNRWIYPGDAFAKQGINETVQMTPGDSGQVFLSELQRSLSYAYRTFRPDLVIYNAGCVAFPCLPVVQRCLYLFTHDCRCCGGSQFSMQPPAFRSFSLATIRSPCHLGLFAAHGLLHPLPGLIRTDCLANDPLGQLDFTADTIVARDAMVFDVRYATPRFGAAVMTALR